ncbi:hypothetical protein JOC86_003826 [Bacillus pakistanensis]|uniref:Uncharacterized protein n=1 Tax=Rossellomorea pakistanensis TaxID=992288 RepID=A0ABS2NHF5_9BACI|nr:hypothetical protein [Bacillus pakistanensis]MBM7587253.1 hypothetical protein [Bacillus pakistanensis]
MPDHHKEVPNTLKYSIWDTKTDEGQSGTKERYTESNDNSTLQSETAENKE